MKYEITGIMRINGTGYKILMYLFKLTNPKNNYLSKICRKENCCIWSVSKNIDILIKLELITAKKIGRIKYLKITKKGKEIAEMLCNLLRRLERK